MSSLLLSSDTRIIHLRRFIFALQKLYKGVYNAPICRLCYNDLVDNAGNRESPRFHIVGVGKDRGFSLKKGSFMCIYGNGLDPLAM